MVWTTTLASLASSRLLTAVFEYQQPDWVHAGFMSTCEQWNAPQRHFQQPQLPLAQRPVTISVGGRGGAQCCDPVTSKPCLLDGGHKSGVQSVTKTSLLSRGLYPCRRNSRSCGSSTSWIIRRVVFLSDKSIIEVVGWCEALSCAGEPVCLDVNQRFISPSPVKEYTTPAALRNSTSSCSKGHNTLVITETF